MRGNEPEPGPVAAEALGGVEDDEVDALAGEFAAGVAERIPALEGEPDQDLPRPAPAAEFGENVGVLDEAQDEPAAP